MSEPLDAEPSLEQRLAAAVRSVPGVARLEPSLTDAIRELSRLGRSPSTDPSDSPDGVTVTGSEDAVDVTVEISVTGPDTALGTAVAVREAVRVELARASLGCGAMNVRVLGVDVGAAAHQEGVETASEHIGATEREWEPAVEPTTPEGDDGLLRPPEL